MDLDATLEGLAFLLCGDYKIASDGNLRWHKASPTIFDGFELLSALDDDEFVLLGDNVLDQPVWPMDICVGSPMPNGLKEGWDEGTWQFRRLKTLNPKEWRGRLLKMTPKMVDAYFLTTTAAGESVSARIAYGLAKDGAFELPTQHLGSSIYSGGIKVVPFGSDPRASDIETSRANFLLRSAGGFSLRRRYLWSVLIGEGIGPRARFVTDPVGIKEVFRLRDIPPGAARRKALLHWVRAHWRKRRSITPDDRSWIRQHLSGQWSYVWNGLRCQIEPSVDDLGLLTKTATYKSLQIAANGKKHQQNQ
jgi:hypothetical protein